jgi:hypothetical protein
MLETKILSQNPGLLQWLLLFKETGAVRVRRVARIMRYVGLYILTMTSMQSFSVLKQLVCLLTTAFGSVIQPAERNHIIKIHKTTTGW